MAVYKEEKTGTWRVIYRYTDWTGEKKHRHRSVVFRLSVKHRLGSVNSSIKREPIWI